MHQTSISKDDIYSIVPKRDPNKRRAVLNLKGLNEQVEK